MVESESHALTKWSVDTIFHGTNHRNLLNKGETIIASLPHICSSCSYGLVEA